jgi:DNA-binding NarL/FixJ family response regulator
MDEVKTTVVIADDSSAFREWLMGILSAWPEVEVLASVPDGSRALEAVMNRGPTLLLSDLRMPGLDGLQTAALIQRFHPQTKVVILSADDPQEVASACLAAGADGFVSKYRLYQELRGTIRNVAAAQTLSRSDYDATPAASLS